MSPSPRLLAIDCATLPASVAVADRTGVQATEVQRDERRTDAWISGAIDICLQRAGLRLADVEGVAAAIGPGTFTGIRVGIATALGLAAPTGLPVAGITTLDALARVGLQRAGRVAACIDARREQVYAALYVAAPETDDGVPRPLWGPAVCAAEEVAAAVLEQGAPFLVVGSGAPLLPERDELPRHEVPAGLAAAVAELALAGWPEGAAAPGSWRAAEPVYLRPPDATPPRNPLLRERP